MGCYGAILADGSEYTGSYAKNMSNTYTLKQYHVEKAEFLLSCSPDLLLFETIPSLLEAKAIVEALEVLHKRQDNVPPAMISFCCTGPDHVSTGEKFIDCVNAVKNCAYVIAIGVNCTPPKCIPSLLEQLQGINDKYILVYPNSGELWNNQEMVWEHSEDSLSDPKQFAQTVKDVYMDKFGAKIVGGCCRINTIHIQALADGLRKSKPVL